MNILEELEEIKTKCEFSLNEFESINADFTKVYNAIKNISKSFSGSWLGYHSNIYYIDFEEPPSSHKFNIMHGYTNSRMASHWKEFTFDEVNEEIIKKSGNVDIDNIRKTADKINTLFQVIKDEVLALLNAFNKDRSDGFIEEKIESINKIDTISFEDLVNSIRPQNISSADIQARQQGVKVPPHIIIENTLLSELSSKDAIEKLLRQVKMTSNYLMKTGHNEPVGENKLMDKKKIFIGHGRSPLWRELKDFIKDTLGLDCIEYNSTPQAGLSVKERLNSMLEESCFALIIMTGEDTQPDETVRARENVVHEVGLFQGKLGFEKAIVLLEKGCNQFSNISGINQLRFSKNNIKETFEDIRQTLEREKIIKQLKE